LKGQLLDKLGEHDKAVSCFTNAFSLRREAVGPGDGPKDNELEERHFDEIVTF
jgi:hypothetical protein